jgi:8-hydroxy-5-deazaflavin:NADPH oxidoreductase
MNASVNIAVLGSGNIGGTLGAKWLAAGHQVVFGVRNASSAKTRSALARAGANVKADTIANAMRFGDVVVFTIPSNAVEETVAKHGAVLNGKIIIDTTNRFRESNPCYRLGESKSFDTAAKMRIMLAGMGCM